MPPGRPLLYPMTVPGVQPHATGYRRAMPRPAPPPADADTLMARALALAGHPLRTVADRVDMPVPPHLRRHKGWVGQLLETALGATAGSRAEPDFPHLGIELKTLPVTPDGRPRESTFVCTAPLDGSIAATWEDSWVRRKLSQVLWVPILTPDGSAPGDRRVGAPILWRPDPEEAAQLAADWTSLAEHIALGHLHQLHARHGVALQLRPKAADAATTTWVLDEEGETVRENPRGFYLRPSFTAAVLARRLYMPR